MNKFFQYLSSAVFRKNLIAAIITVILFLVLIFFGLRVYTRHGENIKVPLLKGKSIEEAIKTVERMGFRYQVDSVYQADAKPGMVIEQDPDAGTDVKENRNLYLTIVTRVAPSVTFPDLLEMTYVEARSTLSNYGLKLGDTIYIPDIARDRVLDVKYGGQKIKAGEEIPKGSQIDLVLGNGFGASEVEIPKLIGFTLQEAKFALQGASLMLGSVNYMGTVTDSATARIVSQSPVPDSTKVSIGTPINVALSN
ncbi:PASTA domain, binds beta-lactams [bacterium A37T11]|nr:PASTA domain, binds beta-lactams [bacterium A37T11]